jgi:hypothetical protein
MRRCGRARLVAGVHATPATKGTDAAPPPGVPVGVLGARVSAGSTLPPADTGRLGSTGSTSRWPDRAQLLI